MRLSSPLILAAAISSSTAFAPSALTSRQRSGSATRASFAAVRLHAEAEPKNGKKLPQVLPGVDLPSPDDIPKDIYYNFVPQRVDLFFGQSPSIATAMFGKPKSDKTATIAAKTLLVSSQKIAAQIPNASEYQFFGNGDHRSNLEYLLKTNPFMASALTERGDGFELRAFDKKDPKAEDPSATLFRQILSCLGGANRRVNIRFDSKMKIHRIRVYEENTGALLKNIKGDDEEVDHWASSALFNLSYYASCVHANIHVLHYILTAALDETSRDFGAMNEWAKFYATHVPAKYEQVGQILIRGPPRLAQDISATLLDTNALLTGPGGFGANGEKLRPILVKLLNMWTNDPSNYLGNMMNVPKDKLMEAGVLTEFMKHHDMVPDYARDVAEALKNTDEEKFGIAEDRLKVYLNRCTGFTSGIDSLEKWIEIMAVTGIVHGTTLSYTRLFADPDVLRWRDIRIDTWQSPDVQIHILVLATICGMDEHRHVMSSSTDVVGEKYDEKLHAVLETYEQKSNALKEAYKNKIMEDMDEFNNYGWILSDFCPSGFDGKQLTVTTYI